MEVLICILFTTLISISIAMKFLCITGTVVAESLLYVYSGYDPGFNGITPVTPDSDVKFSLKAK